MTASPFTTRETLRVPSALREADYRRATGKRRCYFCPAEMTDVTSNGIPCCQDCAALKGRRG